MICEKPSQRRNILAAVGEQYGPVLAARGHLLKLESPNEACADWQRWSAVVLDPGRPYGKRARRKAGQVLRQIERIVRDCDTVVVATDCDREGHLIGMEILDHLSFDGKVWRAVFSAEDKVTLRNAFASLRPAEEYQGLYGAGRAREQSDQIFNLSLTRAATCHLNGEASRGRSSVVGIGRVRTPTMAIVCQREAEIRDFVPEKYHVIVTDMVTPGGGAFKAICEYWPNDSKARITGYRKAEVIRNAVTGWGGPVGVAVAARHRAPPRPMDLTALQRLMAGLKQWSARKTLEVAQTLYADLKLITYPRAESRYLPETLADEADGLQRTLLALPRYTRFSHDATGAVIRIGEGQGMHYSDKRLGGSSHHAIQPNHAMIGEMAAILSGANQDQLALADVVFRSFLAQVAPDWQFRATSVTFSVPLPEPAGGPAVFRAKGRVTTSAGWTPYLAAGEDRNTDDSHPLPDVSHGDYCTAGACEVVQRETRPPPRYSEGTLIEMMRDAWKFLPAGAARERLQVVRGIGTAATRDSVVEGLVHQRLLCRRKGQFHPTERGMKLWQLLQGAVPALVDPGTTAVWEDRLASIENGADWTDVVAVASAETRDAIESICRLPAGALAGPGGIDAGGKRKPSSRALRYARDIARRRRMGIPDTAIGDAAALSKWIGAHVGT